MHDESGRRLGFLDELIVEFDRGLRAVSGVPGQASRPSPSRGRPDDFRDEAERRHAAGLMRVDHAGEVAAQALYHGQSLTARSEQVRERLRRAAEEEGDHLAWCRERLVELGDHTSVLDPLWYAGSFAIGVAAGAAGDRFSLGFVAETERQVMRHLEGHLERLPPGDARSRAILDQMREDEGEHATAAVEAGGAELPSPIKRLMALTARVMTRTAYWF